MAIKSAYDLAMERMGGRSAQKLTAEQKAKLAELDKVYTAKIAEHELALNPQIAGARAKGDAEAVTKLEETLRNEIAKLRRQLEEKKEVVRQAK